MKDMTDEQKQELEKWDPVLAKLRGTLKIPVDMRFDVRNLKLPDLYVVGEPKLKVEKKVQAKVVEIGKKKNKGSLF
jgi:hypothetical protein